MNIPKIKHKQTQYRCRQSVSPTRQFVNYFWHTLRLLGHLDRCLSTSFNIYLKATEKLNLNTTDLNKTIPFSTLTPVNNKSFNFIDRKYNIVDATKSIYGNTLCPIKRDLPCISLLFQFVIHQGKLECFGDLSKMVCSVRTRPFCYDVGFKSGMWI